MEAAQIICGYVVWLDGSKDLNIKIVISLKRLCVSKYIFMPFFIDIKNIE